MAIWMVVCVLIAQVVFSLDTVEQGEQVGEVVLKREPHKMHGVERGFLGCGKGCCFGVCVETKSKKKKNIKTDFRLYLFDTSSMI